ncbi:MAG: calcineurin-like phosphoesterase C-terminal domain-containing protein [Alistipes sp.]|nr:calcineurin-like phosphoesterase C-terminal domain-containing protein [Alistipes sp.]
MKNIYKILLVFATISTLLVGCKEETYPEYEYQTRLVKLAFLNNEITVYEGKEVEIQGIGFNVGDKIIFRTAEQDYTSEIISADDSSAIFLAPAMPEGQYTLYISREDKIQKVSTITVWLTLNLDVPQKDGCSLRGFVYQGDTGIPGVWVSDGVSFTQTDENGFYWLKSDKRFGYVFICLPSGYLPATGNNAVPGYWKAVSIDANLYEQCNFELKATDTTNHQVFFAADLHLADRAVGPNAINDLKQFDLGFIADSKALAAAYGQNTFLITLGDITWDAYWYKTGFMPANYISKMKQYPLMIFNCMGNHDNNPYVRGDNNGSKIYRSTVAPTYYSFDLGEVHYIVLDNIEWINTNGANGFVGERDYHERVDQVQIAWLKEDLSHIADKSKPIVVCSHCQFHNNRNSSFKVNKHMQNTPEVLACFDGFTNVHIMTGHAHLNMTMEINNNIMEHNVGATCETWWQSSSASILDGRGICRDGTPAGYAVFEFKGKDLKWYYKSIGFDKSLQFRAYDMNNVMRERWTSALSTQEPARDTGGDDYGDLEDNVIYINVWDYDSKWKIEVYEEGNSKPLAVTRVYDRDPLHTATTDVILGKVGDLIEDLASIRSSHIWQVITEEDDTDITIKVTNRFGEEFTQTMTDRGRRNKFDTTKYFQ